MFLNIFNPPVAGRLVLLFSYLKEAKSKKKKETYAMPCCGGKISKTDMTSSGKWHITVSWAELGAVSSFSLTFPALVSILSACKKIIKNKTQNGHYFNGLKMSTQRVVDKFQYYHPNSCLRIRWTEKAIFVLVFRMKFCVKKANITRRFKPRGALGLRLDDDNDDDDQHDDDDYRANDHLVCNCNT